MRNFKSELKELCVDLLTENIISEVTPPGMEKWVKDRKSNFKKKYGDKWASVLYATAWKRHKKNESILYEYSGNFDLTGYGAWINANTKEIIPVTDQSAHVKTMKRIMAEQGLDTAVDVYSWAVDNHWIRLIFNWDAAKSDPENNTMSIDGNKDDVKQVYSLLTPVFREFSIVEFSNPAGDFTDFYMPGDLSKLRKWLKKANQVNEITDYADPHGGAMISPYGPDPDDRDIDRWYEDAQEKIIERMQLYSDVFSSKETFLHYYDEADLEPLVSEIVNDGIADAADMQEDDDLFYSYVDSDQLKKEWLAKIKNQLGFVEEDSLQRLTMLAGIR